MTGLNDQDARALTYLALRLRAETYGAGAWDEHGTFANIAKLAGQNLATAVERVVCHASDVKAKTPGVIAGPHVPSKPSEREPERFRPPKADEACRVCGGWCPGPCVRDRFVADDEQPTAPTRAPAVPAPDDFKAARAALAGGKGGEDA